MSTQRLVGVLELSSKYRYGLTSRGAPLFLFKPYDTTKPEYIVGSSERDLSRNQIALVECPIDPAAKQKQRGVLQRLLGPVGDFAAEKEALLLHYCPVKPPNLEEEVDASDDENRQPIDEEHGWITFHIDPPGCRDVDDAIAYNHETHTWAVTIADAAAAVPQDSIADAAAATIGATFYDLEGHVLRPMLPAAISEATASLLPGQKRRGVTLFLHPDGTETFDITWITVTHSFTYESFTGSGVAFDLHVSRDPHAWIEELMIRYNRAVATRLKKAGVGLLRVQPSTQEVTAWAAIDPALGFEAATYETVGPEEQTHASLGLYCHASSPLRRYADLTNQRILKAILKKQTQVADPALATQLNARAKANKRWSRDLTFLTHVTPGRVHEIEVVWLTEQQVWVPTWKRVIRLRHEEQHEIGYRGSIQIFCDPTKRNWRERILTSQVKTETSAK